MSKYKRKISQRMASAIFEYNLIEPGDKILVAVSGGKDSMTMMYHLLLKQKGLKIPFSLKAIHIKTDFSKNDEKSKMEDLLQSWNVDYEVVSVPVLERLKPGKKMSCYWCSTQRRAELLKYAGENGYNKIALGHHMDDIIETFFMNMVFKGELATMLPQMPYDKYPQKIIRPLSLVKEHEIIKFADEMGIVKLVCTCPWGENSKRRDMRKIISQMAEEHGDIRDNIFKAMGNPNNKYLPLFDKK